MGLSKIFFPALFFIIISCTSFSQNIEAEVFFLDGRPAKKLLLNGRYFYDEGELVLTSGGSVSRGQVKEVRVGGVFYVPKRVVVNEFEDKVDLSDISVRKVEKDLFLQKIIEGSISFYIYEEELGKGFLFVEKNGQILQLVKIEYTKDGKVGSLDKYIGVLNLFMNDCKNIENSVKNNLNLNEKSIRKIVSRYNNECGVTTFNIADKDVKRPVRFKASLGYHHYRIYFNEFEADGFAFGKVDGVTAGSSPAIGFYSTVPLGRRKNGMRLVFGAQYLNKIESNGDLIFRVDPVFNDSLLSIIRYANSYVVLNTSLRKYFFETKKRKSFFFEGGLMYRIRLQEKENSMESGRYRRPQISSLLYEGDFLSESEKVRFSVSGITSVGMRNKKWEYALSFSIGPNGIVESNNYALSFGFEIRYDIFGESM